MNFTQGDSNQALVSTKQDRCPLVMSSSASCKGFMQRFNYVNNIQWIELISTSLIILQIFFWIEPWNDRTTPVWPCPDIRWTLPPNRSIRQVYVFSITRLYASLCNLNDRNWRGQYLRKEVSLLISTVIEREKENAAWPA